MNVNIETKERAKSAAERSEAVDALNDDGVRERRPLRIDGLRRIDGRALPIPSDGRGDGVPERSSATASEKLGQL